MKRILAAFLTMIVLLCIGFSVASAQTRSSVVSIPRAPDACSPTVTTCPNTPTPAPNGGGQTTNPGGHSGDEDGDGIPDGIDQCPNEGGPSSNQGCPAGRNLVVGTAAPIGQATSVLQGLLLPFLPTSKKVCALATRTGEPVNVRNQPSIHAQIIGTLDPKVLYYPDSSLETLDGSKWYAILQPFGWVAASAVRVSAGCPYVLPAYKERPISDQNPLPLSYANGPHIVLDKGDTPGSDTPQGYCSPAFGIALSDSAGFNQTIHFGFGDGSVQPTPERGCIKLGNDGHSFDLVQPDPCDGTQGAPTCSNITVHWSVGSIDNQLTFVTFFQPSTAPGEPAPDPDKPGVTFVWSLLPPDLCDAGDQSCPGQGGALNFVVGWSLPSAVNPGVAFSWNTAPPDPCKPGDQSCAEGSGRQGMLVNFMPASQNVAVNFFPNGFDPSIGGFTQIENQPGGSSPGDKYGFTQIENQPLKGQISVDVELPAVQ